MDGGYFVFISGIYDIDVGVMINLSKFVFWSREINIMYLFICKNILIC